MKIINYSQSDIGDNPYVNLATGRLRYAFDDASVGYGNGAINVNHIYLSKFYSVFVNKFVGLGANWKLNLSQCIIADGADYLYMDADGEIHRFIHFDGNRYYDDRNAQVVLKVLDYNNSPSYSIEDGVGNKLNFNSDGLICSSVSCHNSTMIKTYVYTNSKLTCVYDNRSIPEGGSIARNRVELEYDENNMLSSITSYCNFKKTIRVKYLYDADCNLVAANKVAFTNFDQECLTKPMLKFSYNDNHFLNMVTNCETKSAFKFEYDMYNRITKMSSGNMVHNGLTLGAKDADSNLIAVGMAALGELSQEHYISSKYNTFAYPNDLIDTVGEIDPIAYEVVVVNEKGVKLDYFIDQNACITSTFEKTSDKDPLKTLTKQGEKCATTNAQNNYSQKINENCCVTAADGKANIVSSSFDIARNDSEKSNKFFEFSMWLKLTKTYDLAEIEMAYQFDGAQSESCTVQVNGLAKDAWQRVSLPINAYLKNKQVTALKSLSVQLMNNKTAATDTFIYNEIGFAPAAQTELLFADEPLSNLKSLSFVEYKDYTQTNRQCTINRGIYFTEADILATYTSLYSHPLYPQGQQVFDVICNNGTKRIPNFSAITFNFADGNSVSMGNSVCARMLSPDGATEACTQYKYTQQSITITTTGTRDGKSSSTTAVTDYLGKTLRETDEYGVSKIYDYNDCGDMESVIITDKKNVVVDSVYYHYDKNGKLEYTHDGVTGQKVSYNDYDQVKSVAEGKVLDDELQATSHHVDNEYGIFRNNAISVTEYDGNSKIASNRITYQDGRIRTVSDGTVKYGVKYNVKYDNKFDPQGQFVEYTQFDGDNEITIQKDTVNGLYYTSENITGDKVITKVDAYGRIESVSQNNGKECKYEYKDDEITESKFANKPQTRTNGTDTTEYSYDYDGNLTGFTEKDANGAKTLEVTQIAPEITKYTYADNTEYFAAVERDADKVLNPHIKAVSYYEDYNSKYDEPCRNLKYQIAYSTNDLGRITQKTALTPGQKGGTTDYNYESVNGKPRITQSVYNGRCWAGSNSSNWCESSYTADYSYDEKNRITQIKDMVKWEKNYNPGVVKQLQVLRKYAYNALNQLVREEVGGVPREFTYRSDGRVDTVNGTKYVYDSLGRLTAIGKRTFEYDAYGNRIKEVNYGTTKTYSYKHGLLTNANGATYKYNADGVRSEKVYNGITTKYQLDGNKILGEVQSGSVPVLGVSMDGKRHIKYIYDTEGVQFIVMSDIVYELVRDIFGNVVMVVDQSEGKVAAMYRYSAFGNCVALDENGQTDTNPTSVGNTNPFRWKGFYYDTETGLYYANGSYYDPTIGMYLDAAPVSAMIDNAFNTRSLDRNTPLCNNILEMACNPYTVFTATELSADPKYDPYKNGPWYIQLARWYSKLPLGWKLGAGVLLFALAVGATLLTGGGLGEVLGLVVELCKGVLLGIGFGILDHLFAGNPLTWESIGNIALDTFLVTSAILFIAASVNLIKHITRSRRVTTKQLAKKTGIKEMSYDDMLPNEKAAYDGYSKHGWQGNYPGQEPGIKAGGKYLNDNNLLPKGCYREFDINPATPGIGRDASRFVVSSDNTVYLTRDHYVSFYKIVG